ncbi:MAG: T9SS type A sorting domain-containing protein [Chitinophagaceae bacterium]|nr:T9SS type A sorting domain-containing protein [Chitinophagaceae bacterium]
MRNTILLIICLIFIQEVSGQTQTRFELISDKSYQTVVDIYPSAIQRKNVTTPQGVAEKISIHQGVSSLIKGSPDLPSLTFSLLIPNQKNSSISILESHYYEINNINIIPSKGKITRDINPSTIPFTWNEVYQENTFYPKDLATLFTPYIIRDVRGQAVHINPIQYNPVTKVLRVYDHLKVKITYSGISQVNTLPGNELPQTVVEEFDQIYEHHFLNYNKTGSRYSPLKQVGSMLVLCPASYLGEIAPYIRWKEMKGIQVYLVNTDTITGGVDETTVRNLVTSYYNSIHMAYLLLVGDNPNIPAQNAQWTIPTLLGPSDNAYAYMSNNDHYPEFIVGRFSGESTDDIRTQVTRTLAYEKNPNTNGNWYKHQIGISSDQGPGDDFQMDYEHICDILDSNKNNYNYTNNKGYFDGAQSMCNDGSTSPLPNDIVTEFNNGIGLINYCGHGGTDVFVSSGFSNIDVPSLTNSNGNWPFIFSTACINGNFMNNTCLAEALLRAKDAGGNPTGAVAALMSTINQSWDPPMQGQDEMNAIMRGARANNKKTTFGALAMNGCMSVMDEYNTFSDPHGGDEIADTWNVFGDPSLEVKTDHVGALTCTHTTTIGRNAYWYSVNCPVEGASIGLYYQNKYLASSIVNGGVATFTFPAIPNLDTLYITATKQNYTPYMGYAMVVDFPTGMNDLFTGGAFAFYPNPATHQVNIISDKKETIQTVRLTDMTGKTCLYFSPSQPEFQFSVESLAAGFYTLEIQGTSGKTVSKLIKE